MAAHTFTTIWFFGLWIAAVGWISLVSYAYHRIATRHKEAWEAMGSPSLLGNMPVSIAGFVVYRMKGNRISPAQLFRFLFGSQARDLGDPVLVGLCLLMRVYLLAFLAGFAELAYLIAQSVPASRR